MLIYQRSNVQGVYFRNYIVELDRENKSRNTNKRIKIVASNFMYQLDRC